MNVVFDTNVLISAILFGGIPRNLFLKVISGNIDLYISEDILNEFSGVLSRPKFCFKTLIVNEIVSELTALCKLVSPPIKIDKIIDDADDNKILECAATANAEYIVSGDNHLLSLKEYNFIKILSPAQMQNLLDT